MIHNCKQQCKRFYNSTETANVEKVNAKIQKRPNKIVLKMMFHICQGEMQSQKHNQNKAKRQSKDNRAKGKRQQKNNRKKKKKIL